MNEQTAPVSIAPAINATKVERLAEALRAIDYMRQRQTWHRLGWDDKRAIRHASDLVAAVVIEMLDEAREPEPEPTPLASRRIARRRTSEVA